MTDDVRLTVGLATDLPGHFEDLVRCYQDRLYGFALRMLGSPQDAEEATQDAFVRAYRALERYPNDQRRSLQLRAWLYQITLNVVRNRVRRPSPRMVAIDGQVHDWPADDLADQPEARYTSRESQRELGQLVSELPAAFRAAVVLRHIQDLSYSEVAEVLDQPVGTTKSNVHRGLRLLRRALERRLELELQQVGR